MDAGHGKTLIFLDERCPRNPSLRCVINDNFQGKSYCRLLTLAPGGETVPRLEYLTSSVKMQIFCNFVSFAYAMAIRFIYY